MYNDNVFICVVLNFKFPKYFYLFKNLNASRKSITVYGNITNLKLLYFCIITLIHNNHRGELMNYKYLV